MLFGCKFAPAQSERLDDPEPSQAPADRAMETIDLLRGSKTGALNVVARGQGQDRVRLTVGNRTSKRLNVVIPPGLVASAAAGQRGGGGAGGGGGLQSMGLGMISNRPGSFGEFRRPGESEPRPVVSTDPAARPFLTLPAGESLDVLVPAVCLNYGLPTPTPRDRFTLVDVADYSPDPRVRRSLRTLCQIGTSQGVAQAVMWRVCNDLSFEAMAEQAGKVINEQEIALAARFVSVLDGSEGAEIVDDSALLEDRVFVQIEAQGTLASRAAAFSGQMEGLRLLGLPVRVQEQAELPRAAAALFVRVQLVEGKNREVRGRILASYSTTADRWMPLGKASLLDTPPAEALDGKSLLELVDHAMASAFVTVKPARRSVGSTTLKVDNRLPFTLVDVTVKAGNSTGAPPVRFPGLGIGPARSALAPIQAVTATIDRVTLNGL